MKRAADAVLAWADSLPNADYVLPERTPIMAVRGTGKKPDQSNIPQFGTGSVFAGVKVGTGAGA